MQYNSPFFTQWPGAQEMSHEKDEAEKEAEEGSANELACFFVWPMDATSKHSI